MMRALRSVDADVLAIAYEESGAADGIAVVLSHGFPYDVRAFDGVVERLAKRGDLRVLVPYLRGYGPTRFRDPATLRSGQQGALASDLLAFLDALDIDRAVLGGYDWGGRASCIVAALYPQRAIGLVTGGGYNVQNIPISGIPLDPEAEHRLWYQYYFHGERGRRALEERRDDVCRYLWKTWSPTWAFDDETFARTADAYRNVDFVSVVVHSYKHRFGLVAGDPAYDAIERALEEQPRIDVPTISLVGDASGLTVLLREHAHFGGRFEERVVRGVGHNVPQEAPGAFADAIAAML
jgi:pimeloyl-ACP methyl ester carboxylesterase